MQDESTQETATAKALSRRTFLGKMGLTAGALALGGQVIGSASSASAAPRPARRAGAKNVTLSLWMYSEPSRTAVQNRMISAFEKSHPNIKLNLTRTDFTTFYTKLATDIASGTTPDVFMMSGAYFYSAVYNGALHALDGYLKSSPIKIANYFGEPTGEDVVWEGKTYGIPGEIDTLALAYNADMFDEAGLKPPTSDWSWNELLDTARKLTKKNKKGQQQYGFYSWNSSEELWGNFVGENGGGFLNADLTKGGLQTPEAIAGIQFAVDLVRKYKVSPSSQGVSSLPGYIQSTGEPFLSGTIGMGFMGNYEMDLLSQLSFNWNVVGMPKKVRTGALGWYQSWVMGAKTPYPDEAWELLSFLVTEGQTITAATPGRGLTPALKSAAYSHAFLQPGKKGPNMRAWLDGWQDHLSFAFHPAWLQYQSIYGKVMDGVFAGNLTVSQAVASATPQVNAALAAYPWFNASKV